MCRQFGKSRQAYYQLEKRHIRRRVDEELVVQYVCGLRSTMPRLGTRKLHEKLQPLLEASGIKMGRDKLFGVLREHGLLVQPRRKRRPHTTDSSHGRRKYPNIIKKREPSRPEQIWASDITYVSTEKGYVYVSLVTDQYSKKIMGYHVHPTLEAAGPLQAVKQALKNRRHPESALIHHSDRGIQYCSEDYINLLQRNGMSISMSSPGVPQENAVAERVNGILKNEFYLDSLFTDISQVRRALTESVTVYNTCRPHASCDYLTPEQAHHRQGILKKRWRTYKKKTPPLIIDEHIQHAVDQLLPKY